MQWWKSYTQATKNALCHIKSLEILIFGKDKPKIAATGY